MNNEVKQLRIKSGLSCKEMAKLLDVSKATYSKKENGLVKFSLTETKVIADKFEKTIEEIFFNLEVTENETLDKNISA